MNAIILPDNHFFIRFASDMHLLCESILKKFNLNIVVFVRYYHDGTCIILSTNDEWLRYHLSKGYMVPAPLPDYLLSQKEAFHIIPANGPFQQAKYDLLHRFQSGQAIDIISHHNDYLDIICFAFWANDGRALNTIVNNLEDINRSTAFLKDKMMPVLNISEQNKIILPESMQGITRGLVLNHSVVDNNQLAKSSCELTRQQLIVLLWVSKGKTAREIADKMGLSKRTVESYLATLKIKMAVSSKSELIEESIRIFEYVKPNA